MLSPRLTALHADAFVEDHSVERTVDLPAHRGQASSAASTSTTIEPSRA